MMDWQSLIDGTKSAVACAWSILVCIELARALGYLPPRR